MTQENSRGKSDFDRRRDQWLRWAKELGYPAVPAQPEHIIEFIAMKDDNGLAATTINADIMAISRLHREHGEDNPVNKHVKKLLATMMAYYSPKKIVETITQERLELIRATACMPRGGGENPDKAWFRGLEDIALISVMRDAMLRSAGVRAMRFGDITEAEDGSGILKIHDDHWQDAYLSADTMRAFSAIRRGRSDEDLVFGMSAWTTQNRIRQAAKHARLGSTGYNSERPLLGMAEDLIKAGFELPAVMAAGRWHNPDFLLRRFKKELAMRGAVAELFGAGERD